MNGPGKLEALPNVTKVGAVGIWELFDGIGRQHERLTGDGSRVGSSGDSKNGESCTPRPLDHRTLGGLGVRTQMHPSSPGISRRCVPMCQHRAMIRHGNLISPPLADTPLVPPRHR